MRVLATNYWQMYSDIFSKVMSVTRATVVLLVVLSTSPALGDDASNSSDTCFITAVCDPTYKYRSFDGSCNNLNHPTWGMANTAFTRIFPPRYSDGEKLPPRAADGSELPNARDLSVAFFPDENVEDDGVSLSVMQFGQFVAHDIAISAARSDPGDCCATPSNDSTVYLENCLPITISESDYFYMDFNVDCLDFSRTATVLTGNCDGGPIQQVNGVTHMIDGSQIYGSDPEIADSLREKAGGRLLNQILQGRSFLPQNEPNNCVDSEVCFKAGDDRVNQNTQLTVLHVLFMREHNRIADILALNNPSWDDETIYQETRRIVVAELQHITYDQFLPNILSAETYDKYNLGRQAGYSLYDDEVNLMIINSFTSAAYRVLHSGIQGIITFYSYVLDPVKNVNISDWMNAPDIVSADNNFDELILGLITEKMQAMDEFVTYQMNEMMFHGSKGHGVDLTAFDIQRGRDHGIPSYITVQNSYSSVQIGNFDDLIKVISEKNVEKIQTFYKSIEDIDLYVAGTVEAKAPGTKLPPTFEFLIAEQFNRLKNGDRFWYEHGDQPHSFTPEQLEEIKKTSLSRVICDNSDAIVNITNNVFVPPSNENPIVSCETIQGIDLSKWLYK